MCPISDVSIKGENIIISFLIKRVKCSYWKKIHITESYLFFHDYHGLSYLTTRLPRFHEEKNSPKLKDCHILNVIKVFGVIRLSVHLMIFYH